jgi:hypothetical protein
MTLVSGRASRIVLAIGGVIAALRIGRGLERLLFPTHDWDAGDLGMRWREVNAWFDGLPVYGQIPTADYPPGSYPAFWLFIGWADFGVGRWIWAASTLALLGALVWLLVRESRTTLRLATRVHSRSVVRPASAERDPDARDGDASSRPGSARGSAPCRRCTRA